MSSACPQEASIVSRARSCASTALDRDHVASCPACRQALRLTRAFAALEAPEGSPLQAASQIYRRAEFRLRWEEGEHARERAERIARLGSAVGLAATLGSLSFAALLTWISLPNGNAGLAAAWMLSGGAGIGLVAGARWALREA